MFDTDNSQKIQIPQGNDLLKITETKAKNYATDITSNPSRLKDQKYFNMFYGVFTGSEGDYSLSQRNALEQLAISTDMVIVDRSAPATAEEHATWYLESVLHGNAAEARNSVLARKNFNYEPGVLYQAIRKTAQEMGLPSDSVKSVCDSFGDMAQVVDHNLPYRSDGKQGNIDIVFTETNNSPNHQERTQGETIKIGDPLPDYYADTLDSLTDVVPPRFLEQARTAAYYMHALDQYLELADESGISLQAEVNRFADEMADLPSVSMVYVFDRLAREQAKNTQEKNQTNIHVSRRRAFDSIPPEKSLPHWVVARETSDKFEPKQEGIPQASEFYLQYAPAHAERRDLTHGTYYFYDRAICPPRGSSPVDIFKGYLEQDIPRQQLEDLFTDLAEQKVHPSSSKLFEGDRIVLYWDSFLSDDLRSNLMATFEKHNIPYRGFGQDSIQARIKEDGSWKFDVRSSNDQSRGEAGGGVDFHENEYTPRRFFELYLQQMMKHCRNPLDPYRMSFVPVIGESDNLKDQDNLRQQLEQIEKRGLDVAWYKDGVPFLFR